MLDSRLDWYPHTLFIENKILHIRNNLARCSKAKWDLSYAHLTIIYKHAILLIITHATEAWHRSIANRTKHKLQQIQRSYLIFLTKAYKSVSNDALQAIAGIMPIDQATAYTKTQEQSPEANKQTLEFLNLRKSKLPPN